jgi:hypothetical protein
MRFIFLVINNKVYDKYKPCSTMIKKTAANLDTLFNCLRQPGQLHRDITNSAHLSGFSKNTRQLRRGRQPMNRLTIVMNPTLPLNLIKYLQPSLNKNICQSLITIL